MELALALAEGLTPTLATLIEQELADGQKSEKEATKAALVRLAADEHIDAVLPTVQHIITRARRPAAERDADDRVLVPTDAESTKPE